MVRHLPAPPIKTAYQRSGLALLGITFDRAMQAPAYRIDARLRYRVRDGKLAFWFELIRQDKVLEAAALTLIKMIREQTGNPFFFGDPFVQ